MGLSVLGVPAQMFRAIKSAKTLLIIERLCSIIEIG